MSRLEAPVERKPGLSLPHTSCSLLTRRHAQTPAVLDYSRALPQGDGNARPAFAGGAVGIECNLVVLDTGNMLHDAFAVRGPSIDAEGEVSSRCAHVSGSERSADTSSLASFKTASRTRQVTAATSASWSISSRI